MELRRPTAFRCQVKPRPFLKRHGAASDLQEVELRVPLFDDHYMVLANDEARAKSILAVAAQNELLSLRQWLRSDVADAASDAIELSLEGSTLTLAVGSPLATEEGLTRLAGTATSLAKRANGVLSSTGR